MVLVKCKCGCFYTLNHKGLPYGVSSNRKCPNCAAEHKLDEYSSVRTINDIGKTDKIEIQIIPDDANVEIKYRL